MANACVAEANGNLFHFGANQIGKAARGSRAWLPTGPRSPTYPPARILLLASMTTSLMAALELLAKCTFVAKVGSTSEGKDIAGMV